MASHKSSEKRARQTIKRTARNTSLRHHMKTVVKAFRQALTQTSDSVASQALLVATREIRKAGTKGILHRRAVDRSVSRLEKAHYKKFIATSN